MCVGPTIAASLRNNADGTGRIYPFLRCHHKAVQPCLTSKRIEFDTVKIRIVECFPHAEELDGVSGLRIYMPSRIAVRLYCPNEKGSGTQYYHLMLSLPQSSLLFQSHGVTWMILPYSFASCISSTRRIPCLTASLYSSCDRFRPMSCMGAEVILLLSLMAYT